MSNITLTVPAGLTGEVQTEFGNYDISGDHVSVDTRVARQLIAYGFSSAELPSKTYDDGTTVTMSIPNGFIGTVVGYPIVDGQVTVPVNVAWSLVNKGFRAVSIQGGGGDGGDEEIPTYPLFFDFGAGDFYSGGEPITLNDLILSVEEDADNLFFYGIVASGGILELTPDVGFVAEAPAQKGIAFAPTLTAAMLSDGGIGMVISFTVTHGDVELEELGYKAYEDYIGGRVMDDQGNYLEWNVFAENLATGSSTLLLAVTDNMSLYETVEIIPLESGEVKVAAIIGTDGTISVSANGSDVLTDTGVVLETAALVGIYTNAIPYNETNSVTFTGIELREFASIDSTDLPTLSTVEGNVDQGVDTILDFDNNNYRVHGQTVDIADFAIQSFDNSSAIPNEWIGANGLTMTDGQNENALGLEFIGALKGILLGDNSTVVIDFTMPAINVQHALLFNYMNSWEEYTAGVVTFVTSPNEGAWSSADANVGRFNEGDPSVDETQVLDPAHPLVIGANRLVIVKDAFFDRIHVSLNGGAAAGAHNLAGGYGYVSLDVHDFGGSGHVVPTIQRITVLENVPTSQGSMPAMSTPQGGTPFTA